MKKLIGKKEELISKVNPLLLTLDDKVYALEIKKHREKRSLNANNYYFSLKNKLADALNTDNDVLHYDLLRRYSDVYLVPLLPTQDPEQIFPYYDYYKVGELNGIEMKLYKVYVRSSAMDTKQFSRLLDGLISECNECKIETMTNEELSRFEDYIGGNNEI